MSKTVKTMTGLGRGFDALIPTDFDNSILLDEQERIQKISIDKVHPNEEQPRKHFDDEAISQLADSIRQYGILQPLVVTPKGKDEYIIVAGERRWRASRKAGLDTVPVIVRTTKALEQLEIALVENVQRVDLSPLEQAVSIQRLHDQFSMTYDLIAGRLGKAVTTINNIVRLLQLPSEAQKSLQDKEITEGHARAILALKSFPEKQLQLLELIKKYGWSVRQSEQYVQSLKQGAQNEKGARERLKTQTPETKNLSKIIAAPVSIRRTAKGGRLEIAFKTDDELRRIMDFIAK